MKPTKPGYYLFRYSPKSYPLIVIVQEVDHAMPGALQFVDFYQERRLISDSFDEQWGPEVTLPEGWQK